MRARRRARGPGALAAVLTPLGAVPFLVGGSAGAAVHHGRRPVPRAPGRPRPLHRGVPRPPGAAAWRSGAAAAACGGAALAAACGAHAGRGLLEAAAAPRGRQRWPGPRRVAAAAAGAAGATSAALSELGSLTREAKDADLRALGLELRSSSVSAVLVDLNKGAASSAPSSVPFNPPADLAPEAYAEALARALREVTASLGQWKGAVGCSVTRRVARGLGCQGDEDDEALLKVLDDLLKSTSVEASFVHAMAPTEAAAYSELAAEDAGGASNWSTAGLALVVTLGANWGAEVFKDGYRMRHAGLEKMVAPDWVHQPGGRLPRLGEPDWPDYVLSADRYITALVELAKPDRVVLLPTGAAATRSERLDPEEFLPLMESTGAAAQAQGFTLVGSSHPEDAVVRGAALSAMLELRVVHARAAIRRVLKGTDCVDRLGATQLRAVFDALDEDGSGGLDPSELEKGLQGLGLTLDAREVFAEELLDDVMTFDEFCGWWDKRILRTPVLSVVSHEALAELVRKPESEIPSGFGPLIVAELTFSFCRVCRTFTQKYVKLAEKFSDVRFVTMTVNQNKATCDWAVGLEVRKAPTFLLYRRGSELDSPIATWTGTGVAKAEKILQEAQQACA